MSAPDYDSDSSRTGARLSDVADYRAAARRRLPDFLFEYIDGGSYAEQTLRRNVQDMHDVELRQRVMLDVSAIDMTTTMLGRTVSMPVALAPIGMAGLYARRGEVQAARAAERAGIPFILSTMSICSVEEVAGATDEPIVMQLYMIKDRVFMADFLQRITAAGVRTLVLTVDLVMHTPRHRDVRTGLTGPQSAADRFGRFMHVLAHPRWALDVGVRGRPHIFGNVAKAMGADASMAQFTDWVSRNFDPSLTWKDIDWVRERWTGSLVLKGILDVEDAKAAVGAGADEIVVSNHGARQLDGVSSTIRALPAIADAVGGQTGILLDSGVRTGLDVVRAVALGANGVLIGRAWAFALGARGQAGVSAMLESMRKEIRVALGLSGQPDIKAIDRSALSAYPGR